MDKEDLDRLVSGLSLAQEQQSRTFVSLHSQMTTLIESPAFEKIFSELTTTSERIKFVLSHEIVSRVIVSLVSLVHNSQDDKKSATQAAQFGRDGNRAFNVHRYEDALASYSNAIRYAPQDGGLSPIAFGNRSSAFFQLKQYNTALKDIEAAQSHLQYKPFLRLTIRKCKCLVRLGRVAQAKQILDTIKRNNLSKSDAALLNKFYLREGEKLKVVEKEVENEKSNKNIGPELLKNLSSVIKILSEKGRFEPQSSNSSLSSKVEVRYDEKNGRHLVTTQDVHFGDILAVGKPYASVLTGKQELHFCHHCLTSLKPISDNFPRSIPCTHCTRVLYCSEQCRNESWQSYHRFECQLLENFFEEIFGDHSTNYRLALRTLFVAGGLESIRAVTQKFDSSGDPAKSADFTDNPMDYYENVYRMAMKEYENVNKLIKAIIQVAFLFKWSKICENEDTDSLDTTASPNITASKKDDIFAIEMLLRHYLQTQNIANYALFVRCDKSDQLDDPPVPETIATVDPLISLVHKSCDPNISINVIDYDKSVRVSNVCVFFAIKPIPAGTVLSMVPLYGFYRLYVKDGEVAEAKRVKACGQCEHCVHVAKRRNNPLGFITTISDVDHEFVCGGDPYCGGLIRRNDNDQVICCTCKRAIGTAELTELKKTLSNISQLNSKAMDLIEDLQARAMEIYNNKEENYQGRFCFQLVNIETMINDRLAPLALKHNCLMLVDLYMQLSHLYRYCYLTIESSTKFAQKAWNYAEASHTTLERHFGGDSLDLLVILRKNVSNFSEVMENVESDSVETFQVLNLNDETDDESRNTRVRLIDSFHAAEKRAEKMLECFNMVGTSMCAMKHHIFNNYYI